ncbi:Ornithine decarboxylase [Candidozyma auris]|uniref:Ornithine decarboxylase n=2 Tax=Candidozyma auris TaxID=498019 RepID=A0A2H0ZC89_CANAR|nr:ornithine decarboxylase SPE1 [[Candida] auris]KNE01716.2 ornithine decarboxylase [[Candida] auris]PIS48264.1 hypothetical protein B9J08_004949 [[Candida] auris]PIS48877.1 hypothetical protein CJI97_005033 [[Candida] auris]QEO22858.1 hypothetical_protein [[Candida] auris]QWW24938.1 hypothetical protein CA7LBN_003795 [[Candida] auris]
MAPAIDVIHDETAFLNDVVKSHEFVGDRIKPIAGFEAGGSLQESSATTALSRKLVGEALVEQIGGIDHEVCDAGDEDSFFVADLGEVYRSMKIWKQQLPNVLPHYAVKCNTDHAVIKLLGTLGANFDCASKKEIDTILSLGFDGSRIVYANPCKTNSFIRHAKECDVNLTTVDNAQELHKLKRHHPECEVLIRIATDDESAQCRLSTKFGCSVSAAIDELLPLCHELGIKAVGVAFHVGSGAKDFDSIYKAIKDSRAVFDKAQEMGAPMRVLDIGGGFERETFGESSAMVRYSLGKYFPETYTEQFGVKFIAEPGRFMVANAFTLASHVIARRDLGKEQYDMEAMIYINDGVYGNMNCILFDHQHPEAHVLKHKGKIYYDGMSADDEDTDIQGTIRRYAFSIWGPTCDGLDCISTRSEFPTNIDVGDWLYFPNLGAYTSAATTSFNGLGGSATVKYVSSAPEVRL